MHDPLYEGVDTTETNDETHSLTGNKLGDVNRANSRLSSPARSKEVAGQIKAATDPLTKQVKRLC